MRKLFSNEMNVIKAGMNKAQLIDAIAGEANLTKSDEEEDQKKDEQQEALIIL